MIEMSFSSSDIVNLQDQRFNHPHPRVQQKMETVLLKANDLPHNQIASIVGVCENTVRTYLVEYQLGGIERLKNTHFYKPTSELMSVQDTIKDRFEKFPPATVMAAAAQIEELTGIKRGRTQVRKYLQTIGLKRRKTGSIPAKADVVKQEAFKKDHLDPKLEQARLGERVVYFVDAAHFVFAPFLGFLWCFARVFVKAPSGRQRFNVLGAVNAVTHELLSVTNNAYINALSVCDLLRLIAQHNVGIPVTLILDNARYQKCAIVFELAKLLEIELLYLPPYSPNLNLIERMWKFTKKKCLNSQYYTDFKSFSDGISDFLKNVHTQNAAELNTLLSHRFQDFSKMKIAFVGEN